MAVNCLTFDVRSTPVEKRHMPRRSQISQHQLLLRGHSFDVITAYIETINPTADLWPVVWREPIPTSPVLNRVLIDYFPSWKSRNCVCTKCMRSTKPSKKLMGGMRTECQCSLLLSTLVGCESLASTKYMLDTEDIDINGPYKCRVILCAALQRGPMATRLVLEYGASRDLEKIKPLSLQAILHFMALGDPFSSRTLDILIDFGVLRSSDIQELVSTIRRISPKYKRSRHKHKKAVLRLAVESKSKLSAPRSLYSLSKQVVCQKVLGPMPGRATLLRSLGLGYDVTKDLLWADKMNPAVEHFSIWHGCEHKHPDGKIRGNLELTRDLDILGNDQCSRFFYKTMLRPDPPVDEQ